jgi:hypothetical protein
MLRCIVGKPCCEPVSGILQLLPDLAIRSFRLGPLQPRGAQDHDMIHRPSMAAPRL